MGTDRGEAWPPAWGPPTPACCPTLRLLERLQVTRSKPGGPGPVGFLALSNSEGPHLEGTDSRQPSREPPEREGGKGCGEGQTGHQEELLRDRKQLVGLRRRGGGGRAHPGSGATAQSTAWGRLITAPAPRGPPFPRATSFQVGGATPDTSAAGDSALQCRSFHVGAERGRWAAGFCSGLKDRKQNLLWGAEPSLRAEWCRQGGRPVWAENRGPKEPGDHLVHTLHLYRRSLTPREVKGIA